MPPAVGPGVRVQPRRGDARGDRRRGEGRPERRRDHRGVRRSLGGEHPRRSPGRRVQLARLAGTGRRAPHRDRRDRAAPPPLALRSEGGRFSCRLPPLAGRSRPRPPEAGDRRAAMIAASLIVLLALAAAAYVLAPLFRSDAADAERAARALSAEEDLHARYGMAVAALRDLEEDRATGKIGDADYAAQEAGLAATGRGLMDGVDGQDG